MSRCRHPAFQGLAALAIAMVLPPCAQAQSVYAIYGTLDVSVGSNQVQSGTMHPSFMGLKGEETLDSGAKVLFNLESFFRLDRGESGRGGNTLNDGAWSRTAQVGFAGSFGKVLIGRAPNLMFTSSRPFNSFSASLGDAPALSLAWSDPRGHAAHIDGDTAWSNTLSYQGLPQGPWTFAAQGAAPEGNGQRDVGLSMNYAPSEHFKLNAAWQEVNIGLGGQKESSTSLGLSHDAGALKLYAQVFHIDDRALSTQTLVTDLSLAVPINANSHVLLAWSRSTLNTTVTQSHLAQTRLGYTHRLGQRTQIYGAAQWGQRSDPTSSSRWDIGLQQVF